MIRHTLDVAVSRAGAAVRCALARIKRAAAAPFAVLLMTQAGGCGGGGHDPGIGAPTSPTLPPLLVGAT